MEPHRPQRTDGASPEAEARRTDAEQHDPRDHRPERDPHMEPDGAWLEREALAALARSELSRARLSAKLASKLHARMEEDPAEALLASLPALLERLEARGYLDDRRVAERLVERGRRLGWSRRQLAARLAREGLEGALDAGDEPVLDPSLVAFGGGGPGDEAQDLEAAMRVARKRRLGPFCPDPEQRVARRERHLGVLARRGFSRDVATQVIDAEPPS